MTPTTRHIEALRRILPLIPRDPEPTEEELLEVWKDRRREYDLPATAPWLYPGFGRMPSRGISGEPLFPEGYVEKSLARLTWLSRKQHEDPDLFLVPFAVAFGNYREYLDSPTWRAIRDRVLAAAAHRCRGCGRRANQVHHRDYRPRVLAGCDDRPLVALCRNCHTKIHGRADLQRVSLGPTDRRPNPSWQQIEQDLLALVLARIIAGESE